MYDIMIIGSGIAGASAALALAKQTDLSILLLDAEPLSLQCSLEQKEHRVSAISLASKRIFSRLDVWSRIQKKRISPYAHMHVWDSFDQSKIDFDCRDVNETALGYIIEDNVIRSSLYEAIQQTNRIEFIFPVKLTALNQEENYVSVTAADHQVFKSKCLIAADGAHSWVRQHAGFELKEKDYEHTSIVAMVTTSRSHQKTAWQVFLKEGPLAFLPLQDEFTSSIVWSTVPTRASALLSMSEDEFASALNEAFEEKLGKINTIGVRSHFPLKMRHARNYIKPRLVLIGDAAHTLHPLAGQGVNLGLLDAVALAEVVSEATKKNRDFSSLSTLRKYERWRKGDNWVMLTSVDLIKKIFCQDHSSNRILRQFGLNLSDKLKPIKRFFINYAIGNRSDLPQLADM